MGSPYLDRTYNPYPPSVLIGTAIFFIILPIASVALRFYARSLSRAKLDVDDWITIPSMLICIGLAVTQIIATTGGGLGSHQTLVDGQLAHTEQLYIYERTKYTYQLLGTIGLWVIKLSVLLFYRRIFQVRIFRLVNNVFIGLTVAWGIAFTFAVAFQCTPVSTIWNKFELEYGPYCIMVQPFYLSVAVSDLILDVIIFVLPIPHLYNLKLPIRQKLAVGGIFMLGSIVVAIGITRAIIFQWVISFTLAEPYTYFYDITWYTAGTLFWHLAENVVGLLGCCLPTYAPLLKGLLGKNRETIGAYGYSSSSYSGGEGKKTASRAVYRQRMADDDDVENLTHAGHGGATAVYEEHALQDINPPQEGIMVKKEFKTESSPSPSSSDVDRV